MAIDPGLLDYAGTDRQREILEALVREGTQAAAARALELNGSRRVREVVENVKARAARQGYSPRHDMTHTVPDGYHVKGASTLYNADGDVVAQWVKSSIDRERQEQIQREAVAALTETLPRVRAVKAPAGLEASLMACYPVSDHHVGLYVWGEEAGADYDLDIAERLLCGAVDHLAAATTKCERAAVVFLGDLLHFDSMEPLTPTNKNLLDSDGRFQKIVRVVVRTMRYVIEVARRRHGEVLVIVEIGNHDLAGSVFLMECLSALYENEPRVTVDTSPRHFHYFDHGKCLVGIHHGHGPKLQDLPLIMATDQPALWGKTEHRFIWTGHVHHDQAKDVQGCKVESFRVLAPTDAYAANKGYRSARDMKAILLHAEHGEVARHTVNPRMLDG